MNKFLLSHQSIISDLGMTFLMLVIVSGIATSIRPEDFVGKKVVVVTNLKPANLRGVKSEGMILAGENDTTLEVLSINALQPGDNVH